jgi:hypothetical protein
MNFKSTALLFGLLLGMLWLFGLMLASKKSSADEMLIMPSLQGPNITIETVKVQRKETDKKEESDFFKEKKVWRLQQAPLKYSVLVDGFKVDQIVNQIRDARRNDETDVKNDPEFYELTSPKITVTLKGRLAKEKAFEEKAFEEKAADEKPAEESDAKSARQWQFFIGKSSPDKNYVYVSTSDRPGKVYAVRRSSLDSIFFKDPSALRPKALLDANETIARYLDLKGTEGELELQKNEDATWRFLKPHYGLADFEGKPPSKLAAVPPKAEGVKGLLSTIGNIRVASEADFEPLSDAGMATYGLEDGKESLRIQVGNPGDKKDDLNKATLLVGFKLKDKEQYYVRLANDQGVAKIDAKSLKPVFEAVENPGQLRSRDLLPVDTKAVDAVDIRQGKGLEQVVKLRGPESKNWQLYLGKESHRADDKTIAALLDTLRGKGEIKEFFDEPEPKKKDVERGLDKPVAEVLVYKEAVEKEEKKDDKSEEDEKASKNAKKKDAKKKDDKQSDSSPPLKKDAKPLATLTFGKTEGDIVYVRRVTLDGTDSRLAMPKTILEKIMPPQGVIAFFDTALPVFEIANVTQLELVRKDETIVVLKGEGDQAGRWLLKDRKDYAGKNFADTAHVTAILQSLGHLNVQKWVKKLDAKEDVDKYGLAKPEMTITAYVRGDKLSAKAVADMISNGPTVPLLRPFVAASMMFAESAGKGEPITFKFGKTSPEKEGGGVYALRTGVDYLFEVPPAVVKSAREADLRDRTWLSQLQPVLDAALVGMLAAPENLGVLLTPMPLVTGQVLQFDASNVKEIKAAVRTSYELRNLTFQYNAKDKTWEDRSGLQDFHLDADKVKQLVSWLADLHADRFIFLTGGPREEQKLDLKDAIIKIDVIRDDGKTLTLTVGASFEARGYFAATSAWPEVVFTLPPDRVLPILEGVGYFGKARVAAR